MTTLVVTRSSGTATIAAESGVTSDRICPPTAKIVERNGWLIAVCGTLRWGNVLHHAMSWPDIPARLIGQPQDKWTTYIVTDLLPQLRRKAEDFGPKQSEAGKHPMMDGAALVATHGYAWSIDHDFSVIEVADYWADGSGSPYALGALAVLQDNLAWKHPGKCAGQAIEAAIKHDPYSRGLILSATSNADGTITWAKAGERG